jgi:tetratricopeptide (TPR) repeat protein
MKYGTRIWRMVTAAALLLIANSFVFGATSHGQEPPPPAQDPGDKPADSPPSPTANKKQTAKKNKDNATESTEDQPKWDPQRAEKDLSVGQYYMKKGDVDAAIDRFEDAITAKPGYAVPFKYLGEAQEKKGLKKPAAKSYQRYLDLYPKAEDAEKIRKRIEKLYQEAEKEKKDIR